MNNHNNQGLKSQLSLLKAFNNHSWQLVPNHSLSTIIPINHPYPILQPPLLLLSHDVVFANTTRTLRSVLCNKESWHDFLLVLWFDITQRHTAHTDANRLTHPCKYILTPPVVLTTAHNSSLNDLLISKFYFMAAFLAFQKLLTCRSHISVD